MKKLIKPGFLSLALLASGASVYAIHEKPMSELMDESQDQLTQSATKSPRRLGGMSYSNQTANLELDPEVASQAPNLKDTLQVFSFNDNPMVGYILSDDQKINYQRSNKPAQDPDFVTLGKLNNYYVILATGDLSTLIKNSQAATQAQSTSTGTQTTGQAVTRGPLAGGMGYNNQTANFQIDPSVLLRAPNLKNKAQLFVFNDNPMYGYILIDGQKINYQASNKPAQDPDSATVGKLGNYYLLLATGDLSKLIRIANPIAS